MSPEVIVLLALGTVGLLFVIAYFGLVVALIVWSGRNACPKCGKWSAIVFVRHRIIDQRRCYGLVTRTAHSSSSGSISGTSSTSHGGTIHGFGHTSWEERVPVIRTTYLTYHRCKYCQASWANERVEEVEDFDIERE
jgi:hypothetical protein